jgi:hypothetical protein
MQTVKPSPTDWTWLDASVAKLDDNFVEAANEKAEPQVRPALDMLFPE